MFNIFVPGSVMVTLLKFEAKRLGYPGAFCFVFAYAVESSDYDGRASNIAFVAGRNCARIGETLQAHAENTGRADSSDAPDRDR